MDYVTVHGSLKDNDRLKPMISRFDSIAEAQSWCDKYNDLPEADREGLKEFEGVKLRRTFVRVNVRTSSGGCI